MADDSEDDIVKFEKVEFDVSNCGELMNCGGTTMICGAEEVHIKSTTLCSEANKRFPYAELGSVDQVESCGCCYAIGGQNTGQLVPGCGCQEDLVKEVVELLKERQRERGDTAQIKRAEQQALRMKQAMTKVENVDEKLNMILSHLSLEYTGSQTMDRDEEEESLTQTTENPIQM